MTQFLNMLRSAWPRFRLLTTLLAWYLVVGLLLRAALWWSFGRPAEVSDVAFVGTLAAGGAADIVQALYLLAPFALLAWLAPDRWFRTRGMRVTILALAALFVFQMGFVAVAEYYFFEEFDSRLNLVSVDYLMYPTEVVGDIRSEYPVIPIVLVVALLAAATAYVLRRPLLAGTRAASGFGARSATALVYALLVATAVVAIDRDSFSFSTNRVTNEIAANGAASFFNALRTSEIDYHAYYATADRAANLDALRTTLARGGGRLVDDRGIDRTFPARPDGLGRLNVVVIVSESFGAEFSRAFGGQHDWTPYFDEYARQGIMFTNMYASGTRTVRGLEAITASIPPIPTTSILHRPGNTGIANWGAVMRELGYSTSFFYGGYGSFDGMNAFFAGNGFEVADRREIDTPVRFENIWGVADEDLYDLAMRRFDALADTGKPFFAIVMNTSNHKPFTFRPGVPGVKAEGGGRESGVRYADYAQAYFLREAAAHRWFDDTVFVIVADHGARVYGREDIPLRTYRIPMLVYAPKHIAPERVDTLTTQIDVAPTVLGLLGLPYRAPFFGQDVRHAPPTDEPIALFSHNHDVALLREHELAILGLKKAVTNLSYDAANDAYAPAPADRRLDALAIAYYQTAYEMFREHRYVPTPAAPGDTHLATASVAAGAH
ncbi:MAG TPA: LTA synthase family protein [Steroidobacteraceae bacterium]|nr:LTA synthase family protein [Steroidobacteraceae bacterium]HNS27210.1 LTA synthase family protein [Steroidobacteraceae bacterium]